MSENRKNNHEVGGDVFGDFTCKFCGRTFKDTRMMILITRIKKPTRDGRHFPAR